MRHGWAGSPSWAVAAARGAPIIAAVLMATALAVELTGIVTEVAATRASLPRAPMRRLFPGLRLRGGGLDGILAAHLFGRSAAPTDAPAEMAAGRLVLTGIMAVVGRTQEGYAVIQQSNQASHSYGAGAQIDSGITLQEIYPDRVTLLVNGGPQTLRMPKQPPASVRAMVPAPVELADADADTVTDTTQVVQNEPSSLAPSLPATPTAAVLRSLHLQRDSLPDGSVGMRITGDNVRALAALGLSPGDVVIQVGGSPVGQPLPGEPNLVQQLHSGQPTSLMVERDGRIDQVTIDQDSAAAALQAYRTASAPD